MQRALRLVREYDRAGFADDGTAGRILADLVGTLGEGVWLKPPVRRPRPEHPYRRTFINSNLTALDVAAITFGEDCQIGPNVQLLTPTHRLDAQRRRDKLEAAEPITIMAAPAPPLAEGRPMRVESEALPCERERDQYGLVDQSASSNEGSR